ncbi:hypothetical protein [Moorena sp. SIO3H5]|uniref:hypothetical protein n=1 Tax=Moorena sp. SIO3H5 TaxID=2607834 RepID=UPI0013B6FAF9|nr:hypothetical protein [Moorena sp. SIO3H5]NEO71152.1 hypothetical protein [Moorena sp. SIO3H5]
MRSRSVALGANRISAEALLPERSVALGANRISAEALLPERSNRDLAYSTHLDRLPTY